MVGCVAQFPVAYSVNRKQRGPGTSDIKDDKEWQNAHIIVSLAMHYILASFFFFFLSWVKKPWDSVISERAQEMTCFFSVRLYTRCKITHLKWPPWPLHTLYLYSCEPYQHSFSNFWPSPLFWFVGFVRVWLPFCESYSCSTSDLGFSLVPRPSPSFLLLVVR